MTLKLTHGFSMSSLDQSDCPTCGTKLTVKQIFKDCRNYENAKKKFNISHHIGESLGPDPRNKCNTISFLKCNGILENLHIT